MADDDEIKIVIQGQDNLSRPAQQASKALSGLQSAARQSHSALSGLTTVAGGFVAATGAMAALGAVFSGLKEAVVGFNGQLEQSEVAWGTMLKSGDAAKVMLADLKQFAARTPFTFEGTEEAARRLLAMGFAARDVIPILTDVGNASAALGRGTQGVDRIVTALGQMQAKGKVSAEEMNQLAEMGVPAWNMLAQATGKSTAELMKMSEQGQITADTMISAFRQFSQANYGDMMQRQSRTFLGAMSTISDNLRMNAASAFEPLFRKISQVAVAFADLTSSADFSRLGSQIAGVTGRLISLAEQGAGALSGPLSQAFAGIQDVVARAGPAILDAMINVVATILAIWEEYSPQVLATVQWLVENVQKFWETHGENVLAILQDAWAWILAALDTFAKNFSDTIGLLLDLTQGNWGGAWGHLQQITVRGANLIIDTVAAMAKTLLKLIKEGLLGGLGDAGNALGNAFRGAEQVVYGARPELRVLVAGLKALSETGGLTEDSIDSMAKHVKEDLGGLGDAYKSTPWSGLAKGPSGFFTPAQSPFQRAKTQVRQYVADLLGKLTPAQRTAWQEFRRMETEWNNAQGAMDRNAAAANNLTGAAGNLGKAAAEAKIPVGDLVRGLVATHPATLAAAAAIQAWQDKIDLVNLAIKANQDQLKAAQADLQSMQDRVAELGRQLDVAKQKLEEFSRPRLTGMGAAEMQINAIQEQLKRVQLGKAMGIPLSQVIAMFPRLTAGAEQYLSTLPTTEEGLQKVLEQLQLMQSLRFDEQMRLLAQAAEPVAAELDFSTAMAGTMQYRAQVDSLTASIASQNEAIRNQEGVIRNIQAAGDLLNGTLQAYQEQLKQAQENQKLVVDGLTQAYTWLLQDRAELEKMGPAGAAAAFQVDTQARALLATFSKWASDTSAQNTANMQVALAAYTSYVNQAFADLSKLNTTVTTTHVVKTVYVSEGSPTTGGGGAAAGGGGGGGEPKAQHGLDFTVGGSGATDAEHVGFWATRGERVRVTPPGRDAIDYDRLGAAVANALASQPNVIAIDGERVAVVVRQRLQARGAGGMGY